MKEDIPFKMVYDLSALYVQQREAEGVVSSTEFAQKLQKQYGLDAAQANVFAGAALNAISGVIGSVSGKYKPNEGAVGNMKQFLGQEGFGSEVMSSTRKTGFIIQGQSVYKANDSIGDQIKKGDQLYLDGIHKNHLEVFNSKGDFKSVLNLDGSVNREKTAAAKAEGRMLKLK